MTTLKCARDRRTQYKAEPLADGRIPLWCPTCLEEAAGVPMSIEMVRDETRARRYHPAGKRRRA